MFKSVVENGWIGGVFMRTIVVTGFVVLAAGSCGTFPSANRQAQSTALSADFPLTLGMTWDDCVPILKTKKRLTVPEHKTANRMAVTYKIGDGAYTLIFERPSPPDAGPYMLVSIEGTTPPPPGPSTAEVIRGLRVGMALDEVLPLMRRVGGVAGGFFTFQTKERFVAVLQADDGTTINVAFEKPKGVATPDVVKDVPQESIHKMGQIPLDALPEFGAYRVTGVKTSKAR